MWFGDLVTMRWWDDLWLNESFAEFVSHLAAMEAGFQHAWTTFNAVEKTWAYRQDQLSTTHPVIADMVDLDAVAVNFDGITYATGASVCVNWSLGLAPRTSWPGCAVILPNTLGQIPSSRICCGIYPRLPAANLLTGLSSGYIPPV